MITLDPIFWHLLAPELILCGLIVVLSIYTPLAKGNLGKKGILTVALVGLIMDFFLTLQTIWMLNGTIAHLLLVENSPSLIADTFSQVMKAICLGAGILTIMISFKFLDEEDSHQGEFSILICAAILGMMVMASGSDLLTLWVGLETMALPTYVLVAYLKRDEKATEGALKYFLLGAFSSGFYLYGASLIYGEVGSIHLKQINIVFRGIESQGGEFPFGLGMGIFIISVALFFKVAAVPFHWWTPDAYEGAPTPITAFMSVGPKAAAFAMVLRIFIQGFIPISGSWTPLIALVSAVTMIWGNIGAILQDNVKRLLAYSSIAHAGYILIGLAAVGEGLLKEGQVAIVYYLFAYLFMNIGAFTMIIVLMGKQGKGDNIAHFSGLIHKSPFFAVSMVIFLLSLTGIPLTGGFVGKLLIFSAAIDAKLYLLATIGIMTSVISLYYYFRIAYYMFFKEERAGEEPPSAGLLATLVTSICLVMTLVLGFWASPFLELAGRTGLPGLK